MALQHMHELWRRARGERDDATAEALLPAPAPGSLFSISNLQLREMITAGAASGLAVRVTHAARMAVVISPRCVVRSRLDVHVQQS